MSFITTELIVPLSATGYGSGIKNWPVSCATAKVAHQSIRDFIPRQLRVALVESKERHHYSRRAKAALASVRVDERLLNRMKFARWTLEVFDRNQLFAVEHRKKHQTGINRFVLDLPSGHQLANDDGAGAAVTFGAPFLDSAMMRQTAQVVQYRCRWHPSRLRIESNINDLSVKYKLYRIFHDNSDWPLMLTMHRQNTLA